MTENETVELRNIDDAQDLIEALAAFKHTHPGVQYVTVRGNAIRVVKLVKEVLTDGSVVYDVDLDYDDP